MPTRAAPARRSHDIKTLEPSAGTTRLSRGPGTTPVAQRPDRCAAQPRPSRFTSPHETTKVSEPSTSRMTTRSGSGAVAATGREPRDARRKGRRLGLSIPDRQVGGVARGQDVRESRGRLCGDTTPCASATGGRRARHPRHGRDVGRPALSTDPPGRQRGTPGPSATEAETFRHDLEELLEVTASGHSPIEPAAVRLAPLLEGRRHLLGLLGAAVRREQQVVRQPRLAGDPGVATRERRLERSQGERTSLAQGSGRSPRRARRGSAATSLTRPISSACSAEYLRLRYHISLARRRPIVSSRYHVP